MFKRKKEIPSSAPPLSPEMALAWRIGLIEARMEDLETRSRRRRRPLILLLRALLTAFLVGVVVLLSMQLGYQRGYKDGYQSAPPKKWTGIWSA